MAEARQTRRRIATTISFPIWLFEGRVVNCHGASGTLAFGDGGEITGATCPAP